MSLGTDLRALVVDDDEGVVRLLQRVLLAHGFEVEVATDGLEALLVLERARVDLVICDLTLPNLSGAEFVAALKHIPNVQAPVIMVSARSDIPAVVESMRAGAYDYLPKPFDRDQLLGAVKNAVQRTLGFRRGESQPPLLDVP